MYIELIDLLRCPESHEETWLVAAFNRMDGRFVIDGKLGCPICATSFPIANGIADLSGSSHDDDEAVLQATTDEIEAIALRAAAMLGLTRAGSAAVLSGMPAEIAAIVAGLASARVVATNSTASAAGEHENVAFIRSGSRLPFGSMSMDGVMLGKTASENEVTEAVRVLKPGGRLVVTADSPLRGNVRELARDERYIVAEFTGPLLGLSR